MNCEFLKHLIGNITDFRVDFTLLTSWIMNISMENSLFSFCFEEQWCLPLPAASSLFHLLPHLLPSSWPYSSLYQTSSSQPGLMTQQVR